MSWHSHIEPAIIQGDFSQVSQFYEEITKKEPLEISHYWYLGLAYLLEGREEEAQTTWLFVLSQGDEQEVNIWTADLVKVLDEEAQGQIKLKNCGLGKFITELLKENIYDNI